MGFNYDNIPYDLHIRSHSCCGSWQRKHSIFRFARELYNRTGAVKIVHNLGSRQKF